MRTQVRKIGNSLGNIIPSAIIRRFELHEGSELEVKAEGDAITIRPISKETLRFYTEEELLSGNVYTAENSDLVATPLPNEWVE